MTEQKAAPTPSEVPSIEEPSPLTLEMSALLEYPLEVSGTVVKTSDGVVISGSGLGVGVRVKYNPRSQRFEVAFDSKPSEPIRAKLKEMHFGWNRFEAAWEMYTWQVRQFSKDDISFFLTALSKGVLTPVPVIPDAAKRQWWKDLKDQQERQIEELAEAVEAERSSEGFGKWLKFIKTFHPYSWNNWMHIRLTRPDASFVAGERKWNEMGRYVKWGEIPIVILGPRFKTLYERNPNTGERKAVGRKLSGFLALPVYDIAQTDGKDPDIGTPDISGDDAKPYFDALMSFCDEHGIKLGFTDRFGPLHGGSSYGDLILLNLKKTYNNWFHTLVHEITHEYWQHGRNRGTEKELSESTEETDAEAVAFLVTQHFGLPTKAPSYLAHRAVQGRRILSRMRVVIETANVISRHLRQRLPDHQV